MSLFWLFNKLLYKPLQASPKSGVPVSLDLEGLFKTTCFDWPKHWLCGTESVPPFKREGVG